MSYEQSPRRGINMRLVIALVIAVVGIIGYLGKRQINPVTGKAQYVSLSVDQEKALGLQAAPQMAEQMGGVLDPAKDASAQMVNEVGDRLIRMSEAAKSPYAGNFHFHLLRDPQTINAFALPGGQVFITKGLYEKLENEAELAGVLGHEVGHVINRHSAQQMAKGELGGKLATAVGIGASDDRGHGASAYMLAQVANSVAQMKFSRNDESESDRYGLKIMSDAEYDPRAMLKVMQVLRDSAKGGRQPEFLSTHPAPESRLTEIHQRIEEMFPKGVPGTLKEGRPLR
jgi:predicted Zn-dependent protease